MLSVVIPTHNDERGLVPTLAMLVPGLLAGAVRDVVVTDGGSTDATAEVVEFAGCTLMSSSDALGPRLRKAAAAGRGAWLMFLRPGATLETSWIGETLRFVEEAALRPDVETQAAVFRRAPGETGGRSVIAEALAVLAAGLFAPSPDQGLVIARALYEDIGGHGDEAAPEAALLRRLGRGRIARLRSEIRVLPRAPE
jgi:glycosyltransferase involved in cell wall biosynthesis